MQELDAAYTAEFDQCDGPSWHELMNHFDDANLYQAWSYEMVRYGGKGSTHMVLRKGDSVAAMAMARVRSVPLSRTGIAYVLWGPMWRAAGSTDGQQVFRLAVRALRRELSLRRGLVLRLNLPGFMEENDCLRRILTEEGYHSHEDAGPRRMLMIDLSPPIEELRALQDGKWRNHLNRAEKKGLEIRFGEDEALFDEITPIYRELANRKNIDMPSDIDHLKMVHKDLPKSHKLKVILCRKEGVPISGAIFSTFGTTGTYLIGATSDSGMNTSASYLVQWTIVGWLKENGFLYYDMGGLNHGTQPGVYNFKKGLAGKAGIEHELLGKFQVEDRRLSSVAVRCAEGLLSTYRRIAPPVRRFVSLASAMGVAKRSRA